jgi:ubiquinone/menaquinone biosynthesis C-methylase UbiE
MESNFITKSILESKSSCILGVGEHIPFKENFFDLAILSYVYSHFFSLDEALKELHRILKLGGKAIILEERHNDNSKTENTIRYGEKNLKYKIHYTDHSLDQAIKELEKHGFYVLDSFEIRDVYRTLWGLKVQKH